MTMLPTIDWLIDWSMDGSIDHLFIYLFIGMLNPNKLTLNCPHGIPNICSGIFKSEVRTE